MRTPPRTAIAVLSLLAVTFSATAQSGGKTRKPPKEKPVTYAVIQVDADVQVVQMAEIPAIKRRLAAEYKAATKTYSDAVKAARKNKQKIDTPKPQKAQFKIVKSNLKGKEAADAFAEKHKAKDAKKPGDGDRGDKDKGDKDRADKDRADKDRADKDRADKDKGRKGRKDPPKKRDGK